jgi:hypothetical protein
MPKDFATVSTIADIRDPQNKKTRCRRRLRWHFATPFQHIETFGQL